MKIIKSPDYQWVQPYVDIHQNGYWNYCKDCGKVFDNNQDKSLAMRVHGYDNPGHKIESVPSSIKIIIIADKDDPNYNTHKIEIIMPVPMA